MKSGYPVIIRLIQAYQAISLSIHSVFYLKIHYKPVIYQVALFRGTAVPGIPDLFGKICI